MLVLTNISLYVGRKALLNEVNYSVNRGDRVGVVGRNGSGKTHLLELLAGSITPDAGSRVLTDDTASVLLVKQELPDDEQTPLEYIRQNDPQIQNLETQVDELMASVRKDVLDDLMAELSQLDLERYEVEEVGNNEPTALAPKVLMGLGLTQQELTQPMRHLSGGLRMRISLAKALIYTPTLLLLDEPTNHLDFESTQWLIAFLKNYPANSAFVIVSHDVKLLREVCTSTVNLRAGELTQFGGSYEDYRAQLEVSELKAEQKNTVVTKQIERQMDIYYKFRDLPESRAAQAVAMKKRADKLATKIVDIPVEEPIVRLSFTEPTVISDPMIRLSNTLIGYSDKPVLQVTDLSVQYGAKIGILGRNGQGKSTLIKQLADKIRPLNGDVERRARLNIGYFSQDLTDELTASLTVYEQFASKTGRTNDSEIRAELSKFGFSYDKTTTKIENLSGGEKSRLLFCLICSDAPNLIIMDEPTNHLDVETRAELVKAISNFPGSIILVSHDCDLMEKTMNQFWLVHEQKVQVYDRGIQHYQRQLERFISMNLQSETKSRKTMTLVAVDKPKNTRHKADQVPGNKKGASVATTGHFALKKEKERKSSSTTKKESSSRSTFSA